MPEHESSHIPDWAEQDRRRDLGWIQENMETFWPIAQEGYQEFGRGSVVVDTTTTVTHPGGEGHPFGYEEFITTLLKAQDRMSSYWLRVVPRGMREEAEAGEVDDLPLKRLAEGVGEEQAEPPAEDDTLTPPDLETLIQ